MRTLDCRTSYMRHVHEHPDDIVLTAMYALDGVDFDTVVGTGASGSLITPILGRGLEKNWAIVRKPNDNSHSGNLVEGVVGVRWVFVDDFVDSGSTLRRVINAMAELNGRHYGIGDFNSTFVGAYLYNANMWGDTARFRDPDSLSNFLR